MLTSLFHAILLSESLTETRFLGDPGPEATRYEVLVLIESSKFDVKSIDDGYNGMFEGLDGVVDSRYGQEVH